jgi:hypothetical protein
MRHLRLASMFLSTSIAAAQAPHLGNGIGSCYLEATTAVIGGTLSLGFGSPAIPNGLAMLCISSGYGPMSHPLVGMVCIDFTSPQFAYQFYGLDAQGHRSLALTVRSDPNLVGLAAHWALVVAFEPVGFSIGKTVRIEWENRDAFRQAGSMGTARAMHTATALGASPRANETRVLIAGGGGGTILQPLATRSTEIYSPLTRTFQPGPQMAVERTLHQTVRLPDGRLLLIGGADSVGVVTRSCELFDPATGTLSPAGDLGSPRVGHQATLLGNGKVLVTGGLSTYVNPSTNFVAIMNSAQDTAELFDPATLAWTSVPGTMAHKRSGHAQVRLPDGRVLIAAGIRGGTTSVFGTPVPVYSNSCTVYDPAANSLSATGSLLFERGFHGISVLANGDVLVTGGSTSNLLLGTVLATDRCERWNGATWAQVQALPLTLTNHVQIAAANGDAIIIGGLSGAFPNLMASAQSGRHNGTSYAPGRSLGLNPGFPQAAQAPRGALTATRLADGMLLLAGGTDATAPLATTFVFLE